MKAIIYCRVSSDRQVKDGHGLDSQEKRCRDYALSKAYDVVAVFREEGVSGGSLERVAMTSLLQFLEKIKSGEQIVVLVDDIKRFARDVNIHFDLRKIIYSKNAILDSPNFTFDDSPEGKFIETMMAAQAELERNQNKRQVKQKMKARLEMGYWPFMPPVGLVNKRDPVRGKVLTSQEPYASIFKIAIEKYRDGVLLSNQEVRQCLHEEFEKRGLPNRPSLSTTQQILKNSLFAGYIKYNKWGIPLKKAQHEGFISYETYTTVQERLEGRTKPWKRRDHSTDFPLRPHVLCDVCGTPMTASWNTGRTKKYPNYKCRVNKKRCIYGQKTVNKYKLEGEFEDLLLRIKPTDGDIDLAKDVLQEQWDMRLEKYSEYRGRLAAELNEADVAIRSYLDLVRKAKDEELKAAYEKELKEAITKKKQVDGKLKEKKYTKEQFGTATNKVFDTLKQPMSMWQSDQYDDKRLVLFMYFEDKLRYDYKKGFGTVGLACSIRLISDIKVAKSDSVEMSGSEPESEKYYIKTSTSVADLCNSLYRFQSAGE